MMEQTNSGSTAVRRQPQTMPGGKVGVSLLLSAAVAIVALSAAAPAGPTSRPVDVAEITGAAKKRLELGSVGDVATLTAYADLCARVLIDPERTGKVLSDLPGLSVEQAISFAEAQRGIGILIEALLRSQSMDARFASAEALSRLAPKLDAVDQDRLRSAFKEYLAAGPCGPWDHPPGIIIVFSGEDNVVGQRTTDVLRKALDRLAE